MVQMSTFIVALNGEDGTVKWQWPIPYNITVAGISGWGDTVAILANGQAIQSPFFPTPTTPTILFAVDSATGTTRWMMNATQILPQTQAEAASYAVENFIAGEDYLFYSRAAKLAAVDKQTGAPVWTMQVSLEGSVGTGQGANITHLIYIPRGQATTISNAALDSDAPTPPQILANANNWSFQRFALLQLNDTNMTAPATVLWRSKIPETAMENLYFTQPVVDTDANKGMFYYWSNRTVWTSFNATPTWTIKLVGRDLTTGLEAWEQDASPVGWPAVFTGRLMVVTDNGLTAMQGESGSMIWQVPGSASTEYSYELAPTFGNDTGLMVASRCLGASAPNLCMYSAFAPYSGSAGSLLGGRQVLLYVVMTVVTVLCTMYVDTL